MINQVRQRVLQQALQGVVRTINSCLNKELHLRTIRANIGMFGLMKEIKNNLLVLTTVGIIFLFPKKN